MLHVVPLRQGGGLREQRCVLQRARRGWSTSHDRDQSPDESPGLYKVVIQDNLVEEVGSDLAAGERDGDRSPRRDP